MLPVSSLAHLLLRQLLHFRPWLFLRRAGRKPKQPDNVLSFVTGGRRNTRGNTRGGGQK